MHQPVGLPWLPIGQFVKHYSVSVLFSYVALYESRHSGRLWLVTHCLCCWYSVQWQNGKAAGAAQVWLRSSLWEAKGQGAFQTAVSTNPAAHPCPNQVRIFLFLWYYFVLATALVTLYFSRIVELMWPLYFTRCFAPTNNKCLLLLHCLTFMG